MDKSWIRSPDRAAGVVWPRAGRVAGFAALLLGAALGGCAVGPDFKRPAPPAGSDYAAAPAATTAATPDVAGGAAQHFARGADIPGDWWTLFHSAPLDALVADALAHNADLDAARAALTVARETALAQRGVRYPSVSAGLSASREQDPPGALAPVPSDNAYLYNLFTPQLSISYAPDLFGLNRRSVESAQAQAEAARFQMLAARVSLATNTVLAAVQQASLRAQLDATTDMVAVNTRMLDLLREQLARGYASRLDVAAQEAQLAQVAATLPDLRKQLAQQEHLLSVLSGRFPGQGAEPAFDLDALQLPAQLPLSLPSTLVAQRPDVRAAQANLHAASAQVGVAIAERLPEISLTANLGSTALAIGQVFKSGTGFWSVGVDLAAPIFQGGALLHGERAAKAAYVQAGAQYRSAVLGAFQNVADTLAALESDAQGLAAAARAESAAKVTLDLAQRQLKAGYAGALAALGAEAAWQQARITLVQAQAMRYADTAALFQALGGGWWHAADAGGAADAQSGAPVGGPAAGRPSVHTPTAPRAAGTTRDRDEN